MHPGHSYIDIDMDIDTDMNMDIDTVPDIDTDMDTRAILACFGISKSLLKWAGELVSTRYPEVLSDFGWVITDLELT